jgi:hypothetical protein
MEGIMNLRVVFKSMLWVLLSCVFLSACSVAPIREESITLEKKSSLTLPLQAKTAVYMSPEQLRKQYVFKHLFSEYRFEEGMTIQRSAIKVLSRAFAQVLPSEEIQSPNWIAKVSGSTHIDRVWGIYTANAHLALYNSKNELIATFDGKGKDDSMLVNDLNALENAYIKAFVQITDAMLANETVLLTLQSGSPPKHSTDSIVTSKVPIVVTSPATNEPKVTTPTKKETTGKVKFSEKGKGPQPTYPKYPGWAVIIGISKYKNSGRHKLTNLIFADDDAKAFARVLRNLGWSESHMRLLVNEEATHRNIMIALESWLTKAGPDDQIVLFWAGHGFPDPENPEKVYFACYDTDLGIPATGYRMDRVRAALDEKSAKNVVIFADTCHAGKLITRGGRGISIMPKIDQMRRENKIPKGWIFMVGADTDRKAIEHTSWTNGAFTHCLLSALSGKADGYLSSGNQDGIVTMGELRTYMNTVMPDETQKVIGVAKRPVITTSTGDPDIWNLTLHAR